MMISEKSIKELQQIIKEDYGKEITFDEASDIGNGIVNLFDLLAKIYYRMKTKEDKENA